MPGRLVVGVGVLEVSVLGLSVVRVLMAIALMLEVLCWEC